MKFQYSSLCLVLCLAYSGTQSFAENQHRLHEENLRGSYNPEGFTPLHIAAMQGNLKLIDSLIEREYSINSPQKEFLGTPLQYAASFGHPQAVLRLIEAGANLESVDSFGRTPLMWAVTKQKTECAILLLAAGANVNKQAQGGWSALHYAAKNEDTALVQLLIDHGALVTLKNSHDLTAADLCPTLDITVPWSALQSQPTVEGK